MKIRVQGETVRDTIHYPVPVLEVVRDTIRLVERDTIRTLIDWNTERLYVKNLFNDNIGKLDLTATVQYNRLQNISYEFVPIHKEITKYKVPVFKPFVGVAFNSFNEALTFSAGTFYNKFGVEFQYATNFDGKKGYGMGIKYLF